MDIASLSTALSQSSIMESVSLAMLSKSLDTSQDLGTTLAKTLEQSVTPNLGGSIDISL